MVRDDQKRVAVSAMRHHSAEPSDLRLSGRHLVEHATGRIGQEHAKIATGRPALSPPSKEGMAGRLLARRLA